MKVVNSLKKRCMYCQIEKERVDCMWLVRETLDIKLGKDSFYLLYFLNDV